MAKRNQVEKWQKNGFADRRPDQSLGRKQKKSMTNRRQKKRGSSPEGKPSLADRMQKGV